jgi:hypothetical protein
MATCIEELVLSTNFVDICTSLRDVSTLARESRLGINMCRLTMDLTCARPIRLVIQIVSELCRIHKEEYNANIDHNRNDGLDTELHVAQPPNGVSDA